MGKSHSKTSRDNKKRSQHVATYATSSSLTPAVTSVATSNSSPSVTSVTTKSPPPAVTSVTTKSPPPAVTSVTTRSPPPAVTSVTTSSPPPAVTSVTTSSPPPAVTSVTTSSPPPAVTSVGTDTSGVLCPIPPEETNFLRFYLLCQNLAVDSVRSFFDKTVPLGDLHNHLRTHETNLRGKWRCFPEQLNVLFPDIPLLPQSTHFDFSLLYKLIRNTLSVPAPAQGWGKEPLASDVSQTDDVERVRKFRNFLAHSEQCLLTESDFKLKWTELSQTIHRLSNGALTANVNDLKLKPLNQDIRNQMVDDILLFRKEVNELQQDIDDMKKIQTQQNTKIASLEARPVQDHKQKHIRENHLDQLRNWATNEEVFYGETEGVKSVLTEIKSNKIVTIIGGPGAGKTSLARHVALQYKQNGYEIVPVDSPGEIKQFGDKNINQLFILDDVLGVFSVDMSLFNSLNNCRDSISNALGVNSKLICTCRKSVFNEAKKKGCFVLDNFIDIEDKENHLNEDTKQHMLQNHCKKADVSPEVYEGISLKDSHPMFPLLCRMFASSEEYQKKGQKFFDYPVKCVKDELDKMEEYHYAVLVLCMLNSKKISGLGKPLSSIHEELTKEVFDACGDSPNPSNKKILDALQHLDGTYLTLSGGNYTFIHDSIYEIVAYHFGKGNVEVMIKFMPSSFICNKIVLFRPDSDDDLKIEIREDMYSKLAVRLYKDIKDEHLYDVFTNPTLSHTHFVDVFMDILKKQMSYQQFKKMFLEVIEGNIDHITNQSEEMVDNKRDGTRNYEEMDRQRLLLGYLFRNMKGEYSILIFSFIVYYGHSYFLQSIINYVLCNNDQISSVIGSERAEHARLLTLGVYSNNQDIIKLLMNYLEKECVNMTSLPDYITYFCNVHRLMHTPFTAACSVGSLSLVKMFYEMNAVINPVNKPRYTPLTAAARGGYFDIVEFLVNHGGEVNLCGEINESPLLAAAEGGYFDVVEFLFNHGGEVNLCTDYNESPLYVAAAAGHNKVVEFLVNHGGEVNLCNGDNLSPLFVAAAAGHNKVVEFLVNHGGEVNLCNGDNLSPLFVAAAAGHYKVVEFLVNHGGEVNLCNGDNESPLLAAADGGHFDVFEFLVNHGGEVNLCNGYNESPLLAAAEGGYFDVVEFLFNHGGKVNLCNKINKSPLYVAAAAGHYKVVEFLVNHGGKVNLCTGDNESPLFVAARGCHYQVVKFLVNHGGEVNLCNGDNESPLLFAAEGGYYKVVEFLVNHGGEVNLCNKINKSPLLAAARGGYFNVVEFLVNHGGEVNLCTDENKSPLLVAAAGDHYKVVEFLVNHGGEVNLCDYFNESPLLVAARRGHFKVVEFLFNHGGEVNLCDYFNESPLLAAARGGYFNIVEFLVNHGGDVNLCNEDNKSPLFVAARGGYFDVVEFLLNHGGDIDISDYRNKSPLDIAKKNRHSDIVRLLQTKSVK